MATATPILDRSRGQIRDRDSTGCEGWEECNPSYALFDEHPRDAGPREEALLVTGTPIALSRCRLPAFECVVSDQGGLPERSGGIGKKACSAVAATRKGPPLELPRRFNGLHLHSAANRDRSVKDGRGARGAFPRRARATLPEPGTSSTRSGADRARGKLIADLSALEGPLSFRVIGETRHAFGKAATRHAVLQGHPRLPRG